MWKKIIRFYALVIVATWLDMLTLLCCVLFISIGHVISTDYLKDATQKGLDYVRKVGIPFLEKEIKGLVIPDINGETSTPIGKMDFGLSSVSLHDVTIPHSNLTVDEKTGLTISCTDASLQFSSKWRYKEKSWPHVKDSGTVNIQMDKIHLDIVLSLNATDESKPQVETKKCLLEIGKLKLHFNGGASLLYNLFADKISKDLKNVVSKVICNEIARMIHQEGDELLQEIPEVVQTIKTRIALMEKDGHG